MEITDVMAEHGHEQVLLVADAATELRAVIAIHSTALGPSLGGVRFWHYPTEADAVSDALRLSEAMTLKAAACGLHQGGGKAVVMWDEPRAPRSRELLHALGRAIDELGGRYLAAEDVGATTADMDGIAEVTPWVTGASETAGGSGDPSPITAFGVLCGMRAAVRERWGEAASLEGRRVLVQGAGKVGGALARLLVEAGASVAVADVDASRVAALAALAVEAIRVERVIDEPADVLAPCALGGVLAPEAIERLRVGVVCGGANNQLAAPEVDALLAARGIVYAPDFIVNAGGILNIAEEFVGYSRERAFASTARIERTTARVFELAREWRVAPGAAAERMARERIVAETVPGGRWEPGDPAAWTHGAPLTCLRPEA